MKKKNRALRLAGLLLVLALITTTFSSGTLAKYTTSAEGTEQSARVAKFGVTIAEQETTLTPFGTAYVKGELDDSVVTTSTDAAAISVKSSANVVAPGTKGTLASFTFTGTPEVDVAIKLTVKTFTATGFTGYFPIKFSVNGGTEFPSGTATVPALADIQTGIETALASVSGTGISWDDTNKQLVVEAGTDLSTVNLSNYGLAWSWPFSTSTENDGKDTTLGDAGTASITIQLSASVTQID